MSQMTPLAYLLSQEKAIIPFNLLTVDFLKKYICEQEKLSLKTLVLVFKYKLQLYHHSCKH